MKKTNALLFIFALFFAALSFTSCKSKGKKNADSNVTTTTADTSVSTTPTQPAPVIANDDALKTGVRDALKDYPSVKGEVSDSVINLSGDIKRADWRKLMPTLNSLHPKRVNSANLTIK
jgi:hyperosmotically inducible protein